MKTNHITLSKKLLSIILLALFVLPIYGQTEKPLSEFEQHRQKASEFYEKKDSKNYLSELETLLKIATTAEEKVNANNWLAGYYVDQKDFPKAIPYYEEVLKLDDKNIGATETLGDIYQSSEFNADLAIKVNKALLLYLKAEQLGTERSNTFYNTACIYSLQKEIEKAIQYLDKSIYHGYENIEWIQKDSDLDNIRKTEYYTRLVNNWEKVKQGREAMDEGRNANNAAKYDLAFKNFLKAAELYAGVVGKDSLLVASSSFWVGKIYDSKGEYDKAIEYYTKSVAIRVKTLGGEHPDVATSYNNLGSAYDSKGEYDKAIEYFTKSLTIDSNILGREHSSVAISYNNLGGVYYSKGEYEKAIEYFAKSLTIFIKTLEEEHPYVATSYNSLGSVYYSKGEYDKAIEYFTKSLAIRVKTFGEEHPYVATSYNNLGGVYQSKGEYEKAIEYFTKSLAIRVKTFGGEHPDVATSYNNLGGVYQSKKKYEKAIEYFTKSLAIYIKSLGGEHPDVATSYSNLGGVYQSKKEYDKAIEYYTKSVTKRVKTLGDEHPDVATSYNNLGSVYDSKGEYDKAIEYYTKSLAIQLKTLGGEHPSVATSYVNIGVAYKSQKSYPKSIEYLQKAIHIYEKSEVRDNYVLAYTTLKEVYVEQKQTDMAIHALKQAMELVLKFRQEMGRDKDAFTERFLFVFKDLLKLYLETEQLEKALEVSEKMRGLSISENFNLKYALSHGGVSQEAGEKLLKLRSELESLGSERIAAKRLGDKGKQREEELWKRIRTTEQEANTLDKELIRTMPIYAQLRKMESPTITALQRQLKKSNKTFLEYSLFTDKDGKESLHAFVISPKGFESVDLGKDLDITRRVNNLRLIISQYPDKRKFIALKRNDGALVLADARQCKGFHKGETCSKFITDYESKPDENGNFKLKEVILGIQERKVEPKESALLMKQYSKEIYDIVIKPIEKYVYSENGLSTKSTDVRNGLKPFPTTKMTVNTGHIESAVTLPHLQDKKYTTTTNIIICPDAALFTIPFAALITDNNNYLAEKYSISLIQSATAWMKLQREEKREYTQTLFAMGNSVYGMGHSNTKGITGQRGLSTDNKREVRDLDDIKMNNLPGSLEELKFLSKTIYNSDNFGEHIISGIRANKDELYKRFAVNRDSRELYRIIHFSVHGLFFSDSPELNSLALTSRDTASKYTEEELKAYEEKYGKLNRDGFLKMGDVAELDLKTDLLVMSACETSLGTVKAGEGMVGLPQAFLMGGANNVLATLWSVDDTGTMLFFKEYYKNLIDKKLTSVDALKLTQKNLYKKTKAANIDYTDPFYWSPFVVYGK